MTRDSHYAPTDPNDGPVLTSWVRWNGGWFWMSLVSGFVMGIYVFWGWCPFYRFTGYPCPACGMTRAQFALLQGHWSEAISFHCLVLAPWMVLLLLGIDLGIWRATKRSWTQQVRSMFRWCIVGLGLFFVALWFVVWICRLMGIIPPL